MKKLLVFAILALGLVACGQKEEAKPAEETTVAAKTEEKVVTYSREDGEGEVVIISTDNFETATVTLGDQAYVTTRVQSADGIKLATEDGKLSVHFKPGEGMLELDGTETVLSEVK